MSEQTPEQKNCKYCHIPAAFKTGWLYTHPQYDEDDSMVTLAYGGVCDSLTIGTDEQGKVFMQASGEGSVNWYPNFCPVCGRDLRSDGKG